MSKRNIALALWALAVVAGMVTAGVLATRGSTHRLLTPVTPEGCGTVLVREASNGGLASDPAREWTLPGDVSIEVEALADEGCTFSRWTLEDGSGGVVEAAMNPTQFRLIRDTTATAHFTGAPRGYVLAVMVGEGGSVAVNPEPREDGTYVLGTVVTLVAEAEKGYDFSVWRSLPKGATVTAGPAAVTTTRGTETSTASFTVDGPVAVAAAFRVESTSYNLHTMGAVSAPGSYAFLSDVNDLTSTIDWPDRYTPVGLLLHVADATGASRAAFYGTIEAGDRIDWTWGDQCLVRFKVAELRPDPTGHRLRTLLVVESLAHDYRGCGDELTDPDELQPVQFRWRQPPWLVGPDGVREVFGEPVPGPGRYWISDNLIVTIPDGMTVRVGGAYTGGWCTGLTDVESGSSIWFDEAGEEAGRELIEQASSGSDDASLRDVGALFREIRASLEWRGENRTASRGRGCRSPEPPE
ncbi:MAG: hypothetical protein F4152_08465 [Dehalococcoidia bacterium]|nr:hypothetical protein [Dehalococcoidia bacterium]